MPALLLATLDTKGQELAFVRDRLRRAGIATLVADAGSIGPPAFEPDIPRADLFGRAGTTIEAVTARGDRGHAVAMAAAGAAVLAAELEAAGSLDGVLAIGGSAGTTIGTAAMRAVPFGCPKVMLSTLASGQTRPYVGGSDVLMMHSVADIAGLNRLTRTVLAGAADALAGMILGRRREPIDLGPPRPVIAATMFGVTTPCVDRARRELEASGCEVLVFHATGTGGRTMEGLVRDGLVAGVLDITTTELADNLAGGVMPAGPDRLTAAGLKGIPQVISVGALDMVNFGPPETTPEKYKNRLFYRHNPTVTLMRTTPEEMDALGKEIAEKASAASGPTRVIVPLKGVSAIDAAGKPFWHPEADAALFQSLRNWIYPTELLMEADLHINDAAFAELCATTLLRLMGRKP